MDILDDYMRNLENAGILKGWSEFMDKEKKVQDEGRVLDDFTFYWPMAKDEKGITLYTYDAVTTVEECMRQFEIWERTFDKVTDAYIQKVAGGKTENIPCKRIWVIDEEANNGSSD